MRNFFLLIILLLAPLSLAWAAVSETGSGGNITVKIKPENPAPGERVVITINGYGFDVKESLFIWHKNNKKVITSTGANSYSFQLGTVGTRTTIRVEIITGRRQTVSRTFTFQPSDITFSWEAESLTLPLYKGRARASQGSKLRIAANVELADTLGNIEKSSDLNYKWSYNNKPLPSRSGQGKNVLEIDTERGDTQAKINLIASNKGGKNFVSRELIIPLTSPEIAFFENRPLAGPNFHKQIIGNFDLYETETSFTAFPFFWPLSDANDLDYIWKVNNLVAGNVDQPQFLTVRQPSGGAGQNQISLQVRSDSEIAQGRFNIKFGNNLLKFNNVNSTQQ